MRKPITLLFPSIVQVSYKETSWTVESLPKTQHGAVQVANDKINLKIIVLAFLQGIYVKLLEIYV